MLAVTVGVIDMVGTREKYCIHMYWA